MKNKNASKKLLMSAVRRTWQRMDMHEEVTESVKVEAFLLHKTKSQRQHTWQHMMTYIHRSLPSTYRSAQPSYS
ncbi:hypothetical protein E2C01_053879 [Portunus trituberculatus]|uniref:Uncharacterized protein n=1 Tax=Portunus trituberculatus TaxID=210409 RepID=A0A5B7GID8_PORTR|nr:hypothetical protein [Portunus trituberculatus]